jgi:hypothetical protein
MSNTLERDILLKFEQLQNLFVVGDQASANVLLLQKLQSYGKWNLQQTPNIDFYKQVNREYLRIFLHEDGLWAMSLPSILTHVFFDLEAKRVYQIEEKRVGDVFSGEAVPIGEVELEDVLVVLNEFLQSVVARLPITS